MCSLHINQTWQWEMEARGRASVCIFQGQSAYLAGCLLTCFWGRKQPAWRRDQVDWPLLKPVQEFMDEAAGESTWWEKPLLPSWLQRPNCHVSFPWSDHFIFLPPHRRVQKNLVLLVCTPLEGIAVISAGLSVWRTEFWGHVCHSLTVTRVSPWLSSASSPQL